MKKVDKSIIGIIVLIFFCAFLLGAFFESIKVFRNNDVVPHPSLNNKNFYYVNISHCTEKTIGNFCWVYLDEKPDINLPYMESIFQNYKLILIG